MKRPFEVKQKAFFIIFRGLSVAKNSLRPESAPLNIHYNPFVSKISVFSKGNA